MVTRDQGTTWEVLDTEIARSGGVTGIAVDPSNPAVIYVAAEWGGFWKSTDAGNLESAGGWTRIQGRMTNIYRVYLDPRRPARVYAIGGGGMAFRSDDAGATWTGLPDLNCCIAFDVERADVVYAGKRDKLLISEDAGKSWKELANPGVNGIYDIIVDLVRPGTL